MIIIIIIRFRSVPEAKRYMEKLPWGAEREREREREGERERREREREIEVLSELGNLTKTLMG